jgi:hypothetical protein
MLDLLPGFMRTLNVKSIWKPTTNTLVDRQFPIASRRVVPRHAPALENLAPPRQAGRNRLYRAQT